jgi:hypothetical protein
MVGWRVDSGNYQHRGIHTFTAEGPLSVLAPTTSLRKLHITALDPEELEIACAFASQCTGLETLSIYFATFGDEPIGTFACIASCNEAVG